VRTRRRLQRQTRMCLHQSRDLGKLAVGVVASAAGKAENVGSGICKEA